MTPRLTIATALLLTLSGCATVTESRFYPLNWFGGNSTPQAETAQAVPQDIPPLVPANAVVQTVEGRPLVSEVVAVQLGQTTDGVIVSAQGIATPQGAYAVELTAGGALDGEIFLDFRAFTGARNGGTTVSASRFFTNAELGGARVITVRTATNTRSVRRR